MLDPFSYWSRALSSWTMMGATAEKIVTTAEASREVIAARTDIMGDAIRSPLTADYRELARMVPEKVEAFSAAGAAFVLACCKMQSDCLAATSHFTALMMRGRIPTPIEAAEQWSRSSLSLLRAMEGGSRLGRDTLAPLHKVATSNARRLGKIRSATRARAIRA